MPRKNTNIFRSILCVSLLLLLLFFPSRVPGSMYVHNGYIYIHADFLRSPQPSLALMQPTRRDDRTSFVVDTPSMPFHQQCVKDSKEKITRRRRRKTTQLTNNHQGVRHDEGGGDDDDGLFFRHLFGSDVAPQPFVFPGGGELTGLLDLLPGSPTLLGIALPCVVSKKI